MICFHKTCIYVRLPGYINCKIKAQISIYNILPSMWEKGKIPIYLLVFALRDNERIYEWAMRASCQICIVYSLFLNMNRLPIQNNNLRKFSAINEEQEQSYVRQLFVYEFNLSCMHNSWLFPMLHKNARQIDGFSEVRKLLEGEYESKKMALAG